MIFENFLFNREMSHEKFGDVGYNHLWSHRHVKRFDMLHFEQVYQTCNSKLYKTVESSRHDNKLIKFEPVNNTINDTKIIILNQYGLIKINSCIHSSIKHYGKYKCNKFNK